MKRFLGQREAIRHFLMSKQYYRGVEFECLLAPRSILDKMTTTCWYLLLHCSLHNFEDEHTNIQIVCIHRKVNRL